MNPTMIPMAINLKAGWGQLWSAVKSAAPGLSPFLTIVGTALVVYAVAKWLWDKRKGSGGDSKGLIWTAILGAACAGPEIIFPIALGIIDWGLNALVGVLPK